MNSDDQIKRCSRLERQWRACMRHMRADAAQKDTHPDTQYGLFYEVEQDRVLWAKWTDDAALETVRGCRALYHSAFGRDELRSLKPLGEDADRIRAVVDEEIFNLIERPDVFLHSRHILGKCAECGKDTENGAYCYGCTQRKIKEAAPAMVGLREFIAQHA